MSLLIRQRVLAASLEASSGTAETLDASDGVFNVYTEGGGPAITCETGFSQREGQNSFDPIVGIAQGYQGRAQFALDLVGHSSSASPAWASVFLAGCGMVESTKVWTPTTGSASAPTITISEWIDGTRRTIYGAVGTWTLNLVAGSICRLNFDFVGLYASEADEANVAPTFPTVKPPRWAQAAGCVYNSQTLKCSTGTIALGNELKLRENSNRTAGFETGIIVNRKTTAQFDPELVANATVNWMSVFTASTEAALSVVVGTTANNIITIAAPKAQQIEPPQRIDRGGLACTQLSLGLNRSAAAGDDSMTLTFS
jgi:hypothetical protein